MWIHLVNISLWVAKQAPKPENPITDLIKPIDLSNPTKVIPEFRGLREKITDLLLVYGPKFLMSLTVLIVGMWLINHGKKWLSQILIGRGFNIALTTYAINLCSFVLKLILIISFFSTIGIETTSFVAVLGAASLAVGLALQGNLANFAGGVVLLLFKPFKTGDNIIFKGVEGVVREIQTFHTILITADGKKIILPNGELSNSMIQNTSAETRRRTDFIFYLSQNNDFDLARSTVQELIASDNRIEKTPSNVIAVTEIGIQGAKFVVQLWCKAQDLGAINLEYPSKIKKRLDEVGIQWQHTQPIFNVIQKN